MARKRQTDPEPDEGDRDPLSDWGGDPEEIEAEDVEEDGPGEPPALPALAEQPSKPSTALVALGPPPMDTLAAEKWAHKVLMLQAYETMMDETIGEASRRREVRTILRDARGHVTDAARYDYMKLVERDRAEMDAKKRGRAAAEAVPVAAPPAGAKIIPLIADE